MKILVTGSEGFIGKNLINELYKINSYEILSFKRNQSLDILQKQIYKADFIIHLAGVNRSVDEDQFNQVNNDLSKYICNVIDKYNKETNSKKPILFTSSIQAINQNAYGISKLNAEKHFIRIYEDNNNPVYIIRLPNIFGKWCKPNYNSVVATFCSNIANDLPIKINDPNHNLNLVYIDDLINFIFELIEQKEFKKEIFLDVNPKYNIKLGDLAKKIYSFKESRQNLLIGEVGQGLERCLYATYLSYLNPKQFCYDLKKNSDKRGIFVEFLKTKNSGQFSFFTAHPGVTRGKHYHNTKNEKFLVVQGVAKFSFFNILTSEKTEIIIKSSHMRIVDSIPGWVHDISNIGDNELIVLLWANEIFDPSSPDTFFLDYQ